jgi:hypothetical protein
MPLRKQDVTPQMTEAQILISLPQDTKFEEKPMHHTARYFIHVFNIYIVKRLY